MSAQKFLRDETHTRCLIRRFRWSGGEPRASPSAKADWIAQLRLDRRIDNLWCCVARRAPWNIRGV